MNEIINTILLKAYWIKWVQIIETETIFIGIHILYTIFEYTPKCWIL